MNFKGLNSQQGGQLFLRKCNGLVVRGGRRGSIQEIVLE